MALLEVDGKPQQEQNPAFSFLAATSVSLLTILSQPQWSVGFPSPDARLKYEVQLTGHINPMNL